VILQVICLWENKNLDYFKWILFIRLSMAGGVARDEAYR
jgi:hypothetical protein